MHKHVAFIQPFSVQPAHFTFTRRQHQPVPLLAILQTGLLKFPKPWWKLKSKAEPLLLQLMLVEGVNVVLHAPHQIPRASHPNASQVSPGRLRQKASHWSALIITPTGVEM